MKIFFFKFQLIDFRFISMSFDAKIDVEKNTIKIYFQNTLNIVRTEIVDKPKSVFGTSLSCLSLELNKKL